MTDEARTAPTKRRPPTIGWADYMLDWRDRHPLAVDENRCREKARSRAKTRLCHMFPAAFHALFEEELERLAMEWAIEDASR